VWLWLECKVRHADWSGLDRKKASKDALDAFCKDIVALLGFNANETANMWRNRLYYWFESTLEPYAENLRRGNHHFISAFLHLGGPVTKTFGLRKR
jgi:hypothetical protein